MKRPMVALLLNAFILPGFGQLYLGRKGKGIALILTVNLLLLPALFLILKIAGPIIAAHLTGAAITPAQIIQQAKPYAFWAQLLLASFFALWAYGLFDLVSAFRARDHTTP